MYKDWTVASAGVTFVFLTLLGCQASQNQGTCLHLDLDSVAGAPAVTFTGGALSLEQLERRWPKTRAAAPSGVSRRAMTEQVVTSELLTREAIRRGLQNAPAVIQATKEALARELV